MLVLRVRQQLMEVKLLIIMHSLREFRLLLIQVPLPDLLIDPVLLL